MPRETKSCFISAPSTIDVRILHQVLAEHGYEALVPPGPLTYKEDFDMEIMKTAGILLLLSAAPTAVLAWEDIPTPVNFLVCTNHRDGGFDSCILNAKFPSVQYYEHFRRLEEADARALDEGGVVYLYMYGPTAGEMRMKFQFKTATMKNWGVEARHPRVVPPTA